MKTATLVKALSGFTGAAYLYRLAPPIGDEDYDDESGEWVDVTHEYVVASATVAMFSGPETYLFPADSEGNVTSWREISGSQKGTLSPAKVLGDLGYEVVDSAVSR